MRSQTADLDFDRDRSPAGRQFTDTITFGGTFSLS
jgi:hypothetical protein